MPCKIGSQSNFDNSTTLLSDRNSAKYFFTAGTVGALGVPKLQSNIPTLGTRPCSKFSVPCRAGMLADHTISYTQIYLHILNI